MDAYHMILAATALALALWLFAAIRVGRGWREAYEAMKAGRKADREFFKEETTRLRARITVFQTTVARLEREVRSLTPKEHVPAPAEQRMGPPSTIVRSGASAPVTRRVEADDVADVALEMARFQASQMAVSAPSNCRSEDSPRAAACTTSFTSSTPSDSGSSSSSSSSDSGGSCSSD